MAEYIEQTTVFISRGASTSNGVNTQNSSAAGQFVGSKKSKDKGPLLDTPAEKPRSPLGNTWNSTGDQKLLMSRVGSQIECLPTKKGVNTCERCDDELDNPFETE